MPTKNPYPCVQLKAALVATCLFSLFTLPINAHADDQSIPESVTEFQNRFRNSPEYSDDSAARMYAYDVSKLPVWNQDGSFDTTVLDSLIKCSVAKDKWGKTSLLWSDTKNRVVYVTTSAKHHDEIAMLLKRLQRQSDPTE